MRGQAYDYKGDTSLEGLKKWLKYRRSFKSLVVDDCEEIQRIFDEEIQDKETLTIFFNDDVRTLDTELGDDSKVTDPNLMYEIGTHYMHGS